MDGMDIRSISNSRQGEGDGAARAIGGKMLLESDFGLLWLVSGVPGLIRRVY